MRKQMQKKSKILQLIKDNLKENLKEYLIVSLIFIIGIIVGTIFINHSTEEQQIEIQKHLIGFIERLNTDSKIDMTVLLQSSIINNLLLALILWFIGSTVIGIPLVCLIIGIQGFLLGYTISATLITYSGFKGILFTMICLLAQNIFFIPCIIAIAVSGIKLYKSIIKDKRKENIKMEILRHTIFLFIISICLIASSFVETYISGNMIMISRKIFC